MTETKSKLRHLLLALLLSGSALLVQAQPPDDPGLDPDPPPPNTGVPLDGGISLLIAAGVAYAAKKGYDKRKKTETNQSEK